MAAALTLARNRSLGGRRGRRNRLVVAGRWASSSLRRLCRQVLGAEAETGPSVQAWVWGCPADRPASTGAPPAGAGSGRGSPGTRGGNQARPGWEAGASRAADPPGPGLWTPSPAATTPGAGSPGPRVSGEAVTTPPPRPPGAQWAVWFAPETVLHTRVSNPVSAELGLYSSVLASAGDVPVRGSSAHKTCLDIW